MQALLLLHQVLGTVAPLLADDVITGTATLTNTTHLLTSDGMDASDTFVAGYRFAVEAALFAGFALATRRLLAARRLG